MPRTASSRMAHTTPNRMVHTLVGSWPAQLLASGVPIELLIVAARAVGVCATQIHHLCHLCEEPST